MRRKPTSTDPILQERQERIDRLREWFQIPERRWFGAQGTFVPDGRTHIFEGFPADRADLVSMLIEAESEGEDAPEVLVFIPKRRPTAFGTLSPSLRGGYLLRVAKDEIIAFQLVACIVSPAPAEFKTDAGEYEMIAVDQVAAWDGTAIPKDEIDLSERLVRQHNGWGDPFTLSSD